MNALPEPRRIVVGVDGSEQAAHAADWAADLAVELSAPVHLVHATKLNGVASLFTNLSYGEFVRATTHDAEVLLEKVRDRLAGAHPGLEITAEAVPGDPVEELVAASRDAHLLVAGTRGRGGFAGLLLGSVGLRLAAHGRCPTVLIPDSGGKQGDPDGQIVLGVEAGQSERTVAFAFATAARLAARVEAVHVWDAVPPYNGYYFIDPRVSLAQAETELAHALKAVREEYPQVGVDSRTVNGTPAESLIGAARGARMLVVGAHRHHGPLSAGVGTVLHPLLGHSPCPLVIVPAA